MRRRITVYGLRLSKTTFWNRINTGFSDPAVATVLTACGIETVIHRKLVVLVLTLQQYLPLAVLKPRRTLKIPSVLWMVATVLTACGIETHIRPQGGCI